MRLPNPICWFKTLWITLKTGVWMQSQFVHGCDFVVTERLNHCIVRIAQCARCEKVDVMWERTELTTNEPYPDERGGHNERHVAESLAEPFARAETSGVGAVPYRR